MKNKIHKKRELKFRIWDAQYKRFVKGYENKNHYDELYSDPPGLIFGALSYLNQYREYYTIQQFTGLKDKNDKDIYEGDIVTFTKRGITHGPDAEDVKNAEVWYSLEDCAFVFGKYKSADYIWWYSMADDLRDLVIVGNIFENPNLLDNTIKV